MRRLILLATTLFWLGASTSVETGSLLAAASCTDFCGDRAAERCDSIDSFRCTVFIAGCLAGCGIRQL